MIIDLRTKTQIRTLKILQAAQMIRKIHDIHAVQEFLRIDSLQMMLDKVYTVKTF